MSQAPTKLTVLTHQSTLPSSYSLSTVAWASPAFHLCVCCLTKVNRSPLWACYFPLWFWGDVRSFAVSFGDLPMYRFYASTLHFLTPGASCHQKTFSKFLRFLWFQVHASVQFTSIRSAHLPFLVIGLMQLINKQHHIYSARNQISTSIRQVNFFILELLISTYLGIFVVHPFFTQASPSANSLFTPIVKRYLYFISTILKDLSILTFIILTQSTNQSINSWVSPFPRDTTLD